MTPTAARPHGRWIRRIGRCWIDRTSHSTHHPTSAGTANVNSTLWSSAAITCPWTNADTALVAPHSGQSIPNSALLGQRGRPLSPGFHNATANDATPTAAPTAKGTAGPVINGAGGAGGGTGAPDAAESAEIGAVDVTWPGYRRWRPTFARGEEDRRRPFVTIAVVQITRRTSGTVPY